MTIIIVVIINYIIVIIVITIIFKHDCSAYQVSSRSSISETDKLINYM